MGSSVRDRNSLLAQVCVLTARTPEADKAVQAITDLLADRFGSWVFEVWMRRDADTMSLMARSIADAISPANRRRLEARPSIVQLSDAGPIATVGRSGQARRWSGGDSDLDASTREGLSALGAEDLTAVPIRSNGDVLGVALITPPPGGAPSDEDEEILGVVLGNMAILIQRIHQLQQGRVQATRLDRLSAAIQSLPVVVKLLSPDWVIEFVNPVVEEILGYSPEDLVGQPITLIRDASDDRQQEVEEVLRDRPWEGDRVDRHKHGRPVPVRLVVVPVKNAAGEITGIVEIARDRTQEVEHEARAKDAYRMSVVGHLAAAVAHEVNNPLAAITMMTRILLDDPMPDDLRKDLEVINAEAHRAGGISRNLLAFARPTDTEKIPVDVEQIVREVVRLKMPELRLFRVEVDLVVPDRLPCAIGNAGQIRQIFHNLISNSAQAIVDASNRGRIRITASADDGWLEWMVEDSGHGIPEHLLGSVMNPFFTTKAVGRGTGLGLSVTGDIVRDHGGTIRVENRTEGDDELGPGGARITLRLPATDEGTAPAEPSAADAASTDPARVLIIDDDIAVASTLQRLTERLGYTTHVEHRAEAAVALLESGERFDAILSDLKMPGMGGEGIYRAVERDNPEMIHKMVFMSGDISPESENAFLREAGCGTLSKPFTRDQLRDMLECAVRSRGA